MNNYNQVLSQFQNFINMNFLDILKISPIESLTPFNIENMITDELEFFFIAKCSSYVYQSVKERDIHTPTNVNVTMYIEDDNLIIRFEVLDMMLETEIVAEKAKSFLSVLINQEKITLAIVDAQTYNLVWITNTIPFKTIRFHYKEIFELYGVI